VNGSESALIFSLFRLISDNKLTTSPARLQSQKRVIFEWRMFFESLGGEKPNLSDGGVIEPENLRAGNISDNYL